MEKTRNQEFFFKASTVSVHALTCLEVRVLAFSQDILNLKLDSNIDVQSGAEFHYQRR